MFLQAVIITLAAALTGLGEANFQKPKNGGEIKAVLIAGSKTYNNYRHQANICHAYQILRKNGIPEENIIVMMYDDIAFNEKNPDKGVIINRPGGPNVYKDVKKDYVGKDVNKKVFFDVLLGNKKAVNGVGSGRVLESGPNDFVFVNFVDHGGPGVLCMPEDNDYVKATDLLKVLKEMAGKSRFQKMFFYVEACHSGSMFDDLLSDDLNIFVMTAADPYESSWASFHDERLNTFLGDVFSGNWMHNTETANLTTEDVNRQFQKVRTKTITSHVEEYGDINIGNTKLSEVFGYRKQPLAHYELDFTDAVPAHHVPVAILARRIQGAKNLEEKKRLEKELHEILQGRKEVLQFFLKLVEVTPANNDFLYLNSTSKKPVLTKKNLACYENALSHFNDKCFDICPNPFVTSQLHKIIYLCNVMPEAEVVEKVISLCHGKPKRGGIV